MPSPTAIVEPVKQETCGTAQTCQLSGGRYLACAKPFSGQNAAEGSRKSKAADWTPRRRVAAGTAYASAPRDHFGASPFCAKECPPAPGQRKRAMLGPTEGVKGRGVWALPLNGSLL